MKLRTALDEAPPAVDVAEKATKIRVNLLRDVAKWLAGGEDKGATTLLPRLRSRLFFVWALVAVPQLNSLACIFAGLGRGPV